MCCTNNFMSPIDFEYIEAAVRFTRFLDVNHFFSLSSKQSIEFTKVLGVNHFFKVLGVNHIFSLLSKQSIGFTKFLGVNHFFCLLSKQSIFLIVVKAGGECTNTTTQCHVMLTSCPFLILLLPPSSPSIRLRICYW